MRRPKTAVLYEWTKGERYRLVELTHPNNDLAFIIEMRQLDAIGEPRWIEAFSIAPDDDDATSEGILIEAIKDLLISVSLKKEKA